MTFDNRKDSSAPKSGAAPAADMAGDSAKSASIAVTVPVILSGGAGTRLWPCSTEASPKQFLPLLGSQSLFEATLARVSDDAAFCAPIVVTGALHADLCENALTDQRDARIILEPFGRNTAAAIVMAASVAADLHGEDSLLLVMPSDHVVDDVPALHEAVRQGATAARAGRLVTFGIAPTGPETGYGYLESGDEIAGLTGVESVARFVEKPDEQTAREMLETGNHYWNAGIFLFSAGAFLEEAGLHAPEIVRSARDAIASGRTEGRRILPDADHLAACPSQSVDYAVMELSSSVAVVPMAPGWSDVGSWDALAELAGRQTTVGPVTELECDGCYIRSDGLEIAALGLSDLIVIASGNRLLILPRGRSQEVKKLVGKMSSTA